MGKRYSEIIRTFAEYARKRNTEYITVHRKAFLYLVLDHERRISDDKWLRDNGVTIGNGKSGRTWIYWEDGRGSAKEADGPTLHAAIAAAKGEK